MTTDEELHQKAIAHELFCELSSKSRMVASVFYGYCWSRKRALFDCLLTRREKKPNDDNS